MILRMYLERFAYLERKTNSIHRKYFFCFKNILIVFVYLTLLCRNEPRTSLPFQYLSSNSKGWLELISNLYIAK